MLLYLLLCVLLSPCWRRALRGQTSVPTEIPVAACHVRYLLRVGLHTALKQILQQAEGGPGAAVVILKHPNLPRMQRLVAKAWQSREGDYYTLSR